MRRATSNLERDEGASRRLPAGLVMGAWLIGVAVCAGVSGCARTKSDKPMSAEERAALPGLIVFVRERQGGRDVWAIRPTGEERPVSTGPADEYPGAASPDGEHLVIIATRNDGSAHFEQLLWISLRDGTAVPMGSPGPRARLPVFAPDGRSVLAESGVGGLSDIVRYAVPPSSSPPTTLVHLRAGAFDPAVSPDGRLLAYVGSEEGDPEVYLAAADGTHRRRLTAFYSEDISPSFSPDGAWIAFLSNRERRQRAFLVRPDGTGLRPLLAKELVGHEEAVVFRPSGREALVVERLAKGTTRLWTTSVDADGKDPRAHTDGSHRDEWPAWSPDGRAYVFASDRSGDGELYLARADGSGVVQLTHSPGPDWLPRWVISPL